MTDWDNLKPVEKMNYCKGDLKTGKPLVVSDLVSGKTINTDKWFWDGFEKDGITPVRFQCIFTGKKQNSSGAKAMLEKLQ